MGNIDRNHILELLEKHSALEEPDSRLTNDILQILNLEGTCSLASVLNSHVKEEREAGINMIRKHLDGLLSDDEEVVNKTRELVGDFYYCIDDSGIIEP